MVGKKRVEGEVGVIWLGGVYVGWSGIGKIISFLRIGVLVVLVIVEFLVLGLGGGRGRCLYSMV